MNQIYKINTVYLLNINGMIMVLNNNNNNNNNINNIDIITDCPQ